VNRDIALSGAFHSATLTRRTDGATLTFGGRGHACVLQDLGGGEYRLAVDGKTHRIWVAVHRGFAYVHAFGRAWELEVVDPVTRAQRAAGGGEAIATAPMPGTVVRIMVAEGDAVHKGQPLLVIESMKMQTEIVARGNGTIERVFVTENQTFDRGARLVALAARE
jgi:3-methylcrotonyl-CoA carboxylase alpha subunit